MEIKLSTAPAHSNPLLFKVKSHLEEVSALMHEGHVNAAMVSMQRIMDDLDITEISGKDRSKFDCVRAIRHKCKDLQDEYPYIADVYLVHVSFMQHIGFYSESYYYLEKMIEYDLTKKTPPIKISSEQWVQTYDCLAKLYLHNGAIPGAKLAATKALGYNPNHKPAQMVLRICQRAEMYNENTVAAKRTCNEAYTFAYLTTEDTDVLDYLNLKVKKDKPKSFASSKFGFLAEMGKKLAKTIVQPAARDNSQHESINAPRFKRT